MFGLFSVAALQLLQPTQLHTSEHHSRSLFSDPALDPRVRSILRRSCADCHSDETRVPWYARVSPVSWFIMRHIDRGREKLNFSDWPKDPTDEKQDIADSVDKGEMPIFSYLLIHRSARLSDNDRRVLDKWADSQ